MATGTADTDPVVCTNGSVTTCAGFTYDADPFTASQQKMQCVLNTMTSGSVDGYQHGSVCGRRMNGGIWDSMNVGGDNEGLRDPDNFKNDGLGCVHADCSANGSGGGTVNGKSAIGLSTFFEGTPRSRMVQGELSVSANVGSGAVEEEHLNERVNNIKCPVISTASYIVTRTGASAATIAIEVSWRRHPTQWGQPGYGGDAECVGAGSWLAEEFAQPRRVKINVIR